MTRRASTPEIDAEYLLETFLENTPDHMYIKDLDGRFTQLSASLGRWMGLDDPQRAVGLTDFDFFAASHAEPARAAELEIMRTGMPIIGLEEREEWPDGRVTWVSTTKVPLRSRDQRMIGIFGLSRDITERKLADERAQAQADQLETLAAQLEQLSLEDELTDLYNRRGLDLLGGNAVARAARDGSPLCVLFMDLDGLKTINDGFGHAAGDTALVTAAADPARHRARDRHRRPHRRRRVRRRAGRRLGPRGRGAVRARARAAYASAPGEHP